MDEVVHVNHCDDNNNNNTTTTTTTIEVDWKGNQILDDVPYLECPAASHLEDTWNALSIRSCGCGSLYNPYDDNNNVVADTSRSDNNNNNNNNHNDTSDVASVFARVQRTEIYSKHYQPNQREREEMKESLRSVGIRGNNYYFGSAKRPVALKIRQAASSGIFNKVRHDASETSTSPLSKNNIVLHAQNGVFCLQGSSKHPCRLLLLTHCLIIKPLRGQRRARAVEWAQVQTIAPNGADPETWCIVLHSSSCPGKVRETKNNNIAAHETAEPPISLSCPNRDPWLQSLQIVVQNYALHHPCDNNDVNAHQPTTTATATTTTLGWQHAVVQAHPPFALAVTGEVLAHATHMPPGIDWNARDNQGFAPLHYAARLGHKDACEYILQQQSVNLGVLDSEGRSAIDACAIDEQHDMVELLQRHNAVVSEACKTRKHGKLFGQVAQVQQRINQKWQERNNIKQLEAMNGTAQEEANKASAAASLNLQLMRERGEKIEKLGAATTELTDNTREFASLARQLNEQSAKRSKRWGMPSIF